jgi:hypothetical protein
MRLDFNTTLTGGTRKKLRNWTCIAGKATINILNTFGMTRQNKRLTISTLTCNMKEKRPHNSTFAIGGVSYSADSFVVAESFVLRINISGKNPAHRKSAKRYASA